MIATIDFGPRVEREVKKIQSDEELCGKNRELLLEFKRDLKLDDLSDAYVHKVLTHNRIMAEQLEGTSFEEASEDDLKDIVE